MGRVAVVTGAASGMGLAIAHRLASCGNSVALFDRHGEAAQEAAEKVRVAGGQALAWEVDVADRVGIEAALDRVRRDLGPIEIMVTSAGIEGFQTFTDIDIDAWDRMIAVNLTGTFHCIQAAVPDMVASGWGRIVTISSSSAQSGTRRMAHYVASKAGVIGLTKALAIELAPHGITANTIPPGFIDTPMVRRTVASGELPVLEDLVSRTPVGRAGTPEDIAAACAFLCSEEAGYITGQLIGVNGGWYV